MNFMNFVKLKCWKCPKIDFLEMLARMLYNFELEKRHFYEKKAPFAQYIYIYYVPYFYYFLHA